MTEHEYAKKQIGWFLASQNVSLFGSQVVSYAIIWHVTITTSSGIWLMLVTLCSMLPQALISPWSGVWADRYSRKKLIVFSDSFIAFATFLLMISFALGYKQLVLLLVVSVIRSIGAGIQTPAVNAIFPELISQKHLTRVQGINQTLGAAMMLLAPAIGGVILSMAGLLGTFMFDIVTACTAIVIMLKLQFEGQPRVKEPLSVGAEFRAGFNYAVKNMLLRKVIICYGVSFVLFTPAATLAPLLIERTYGSELWRLTLNQVIWSAGSILGGSFLSLHGEFKNKNKIVSLCLLLFGGVLALQGLTTSFFLYQVFVGVTGGGGCCLSS